MKRSSCLSATLVSLVAVSLTSASVAFADPVLVAQADSKRPLTSVQPSDQTGGGSNPTAAPATADTSPAPIANPNASVTIGSASSAPGVDAPNGSASEPAKETAPRRWAGTQIFAATSMTTATIFKGQTQYNNPTVDSAIYLTPRFAINDAWQIRGRLIFNYEFTNSDETVTKNEPRFSDTTLSLFYRKIPELPGGIKPAAAFNLSLPTSPESRARTLVVSPSLTAQLSKTIEHIPGHGSLDFLASGSYAHPFYRSTTPEIRGDAPYGFQCAGGTTCGDQLSGIYNPANTISYSFLVAATWGKWSPALYYVGTSQWAYTGEDITFQGHPLSNDDPNNFGPTRVRQQSYFSAWIDYEANTWLTAELGYSLSRSALDGSAHYGNPIWDRYQDQRVFIGANFNIDNIMKQLEGGPTEAGIVRAENKKPIVRF